MLESDWAYFENLWFACRPSPLSLHYYYYTIFDDISVYYDPPNCTRAGVRHQQRYYYLFRVLYMGDCLCILQLVQLHFPAIQQARAKKKKDVIKYYYNG